MNSFLKITSVFAMTAALAACGQKGPSEGMVMSDFNNALDLQIVQSDLMEKSYRETPEIAEYLGPNKLVPSEALKKIKASGKFNACRDGDFEGQVICNVEASLEGHSQMFEYAYLKNGDQWQSTGGYRKGN
tara:strand:+ start:763 stop:1155 length:393 start_codon:yes stop_codon:yes gene_type:complete